MENIRSAEVALTGTGYLVMNDMNGADPDTELSREYNGLVDAGRGRNTLTEAQEARKRRIQWERSLYLSKDGQLVFPVYNVLQCLTAAAKTYRLGSVLERGAVQILGSEVPVTLPPDGEQPGEPWLSAARSLDALYEQTRWTCFVNGNPSSGKGSSKVQLTRPRFQPWSLAFTAEVDTESLNWPDFEKIVHTAGRVGIGNARKLGHGRFTAEIKQL